ncbi:MAG: fructosamine kinase family protein [Planctomycetota bacterium]|jgi:fructosamine-3-kinase
MSVSPVIKRALQASDLPADGATMRDLGGGCIHRVRRVTLRDGRAVVAKTNRAAMLPLFEEEAASLRAIAATQTILVPQPLVTITHDDEAVFLMTALEPGAATQKAWRSFGEELAHLHAGDAGTRYGFDIDNHLGTTPQPNTWCGDWVEFNSRYRLGYQVELARESGRMDAHEVGRVGAVIDRLARLIPRRPKPALLHGDLWSGNALPAASGEGEPRIAVIDPACSIGDGWADIAMMRLFGGFARGCFEAYTAAADDRQDVEQRVAVYQLYHVLNHVNLFGGGYVSQAMALVGRLGC